jgi:hypothetical protein
MKTYTRIEVEDVMFSFNSNQPVTEDVLADKITKFLLDLPTKVASTVEFNLRVHYESTLREDEHRKD